MFWGPKADIKQCLDMLGSGIGELEFSTNVAGVTVIKNSKVVLNFLRTVPGDKILVRLEREPENQFDKNAVRVEVSVKGARGFYRIGYIPKDFAYFMSYVMDHGFCVNILESFVCGGVYERENVGFFLKLKVCPV